MWCSHKYEEKERFYDKLDGITSLKGGTDQLARMIFGMTTILYTCVKCGKPVTKEILGKMME